jgi:universal stress protein E
MASIRRILVAIKDPWAKHLPALDRARQLAKALDAQLVLFHGIADPIYVDEVILADESLSRFETQGSNAHRRRLEQLAKRIRRSGLEVTTAVEWDFPLHEAIIRAAARFCADLIVTQCHPSKHVAPWLLRFTDWELLRNSPRPVLIVKGRARYRHPTVLAAIDPAHTFAKPAKLDQEILRLGSAITRALRGALHAVYAYDPLLVGMTPTQLSAPDGIARAQAKAAAHAGAIAGRELGVARIPPARRHILDGNAADIIVEVGEQINAGLVVMGCNSRSGLRRIFIGNTAERVLDRVECDVLAVKPRRFRDGVTRVSRGPRLVVPALVGI